jgi:hypothetical protein
MAFLEVNLALAAGGFATAPVRHHINRSGADCQRIYYCSECSERRNPGINSERHVTPPSREKYPAAA